MSQEDSPAANESLNTDTDNSEIEIPVFSTLTRSEYKITGVKLFDPLPSKTYKPRKRISSSLVGLTGDSLTSVPEEVEADFTVQREDLSWDHNPHSVSSLDTSFTARDRLANFSTSTQDFEAMPDETKKNQILHLITLWEDDFSRLNVERLSQKVLESEIPKAEELKDKIRDLLFDLRCNDPAVYTTVSEDGNRAKDSLVDFLFLAKEKVSQFHVQEVEQQSRPPSAQSTSVNDNVVSFLGKRVDAQLKPTIDDIETVTKALKDLTQQQVNSDVDFLKFEELHIGTIKRAEKLVLDASRLVDDAVTADKVDSATQIDTKVNKLKSEIDKSVSAKLKLKSTMGLLGSNSLDKNVSLDLPKFDGKLGNMDFWTFKKKFEEYISLVRVSKQKELHLLQTDSMATQALKNNLSRFDSVGDCFDYLEKHYGNVKVLFNYKKAELLRIGKFPRYEPGKGQPSPLKQKDWLLDLQSKFEAVVDLAEHHQIENSLYYSNVLDQVEQLFPEMLKDEFAQHLTSHGNPGQGKEIYDEFAQFIENLIDRYTTKSDRYMSSLDFTADKTEKSRNLDNKFKNLLYGEDEATEDTDVDKKGKKKIKPLDKKDKTKTKPAGKAKNQEIVCQNVVEPQELDCPFYKCQEKHTHIFYCPIFRGQTDFGKRLKMITGKYICMRCLRLDSKVDLKNRKKWWESHEPNCKSNFSCDVGACKEREPRAQLHMVVCGASGHYNANKSKEQVFLDSLDKKLLENGPSMFTFFYSSNIQDVHDFDDEDVGDGLERNLDGKEPDCNDPSIFMLHDIEVEGKSLLVFYDSGGGGAGISERAYKYLDTKNVRPGPTLLNVAGGQRFTVPGGDEQFDLKLENGNQASIVALKMNCVTSNFPKWDIQEAWQDVVKYHSDLNFDYSLPKAPLTVGGASVDILVGIKYWKFFPKELFTLPCGLGVFKSKLKCSNGSQALLGGCHKSWRNAEAMTQNLSPMMFLSQECKAYYFQDRSLRYPISIKDVTKTDDDLDEEFDIDLDAIDEKNDDPKCCDDEFINAEFQYSSIKTEIKNLEELDNIGSSVTYRCPKCRNCSDCTKGDNLEAISLNEEKEDHMIEACLRYDSERKVLVTYLPFIKPPEEALNPNYNVAMKIFQSQKKLINKSPGMKDDLLHSFEKLESKKFVVKVKDLDPEIIKKILEAKTVKYYIPWRSVYKLASLSTPCRIVFDASSRTPGGLSLNECLAVGRNLLSSLFKILLNFKIHLIGVIGDISQAYNNIRLEPEHYQFQLFLWQDQLDDNEAIETWAVVTTIYGVRNSGNTTIKGVKMLSTKKIAENPTLKLGHRALCDESYLDDVISGAKDDTEAVEVTKQVDEILDSGSMKVKEYTFSGKRPGEKVSSDGVHVGVLGYLWDSYEDTMCLDKKDIYLEKIKRGKPPKAIVSDFEDELKRCFSKRVLCRVVASVYDPIGYTTPVTSGLRRDLHEIMMLKTDWDQEIPLDYLTTWVKNLKIIQKLKNVKFPRCVIPKDFAEEKVELIVSCDASQETAAAVVHARVKKRNGDYSCNILASKSKLVSTSTIPIAELKAARIAVSLAYVAQSVLGDKHKKTIFVTDSSIVLHWIHADSRPLPTVVRNSVIEIRRFSSPTDWRHVASELNIADLATRDITDVNLIDIGSEWQDGKSWMTWQEEDMPLKTLQDVKLSDNERREAALETKIKIDDTEDLVTCNTKLEDDTAPKDDTKPDDDTAPKDDTKLDDDTAPKDDTNVFDTINVNEDDTEVDEVEMLTVRYEFSNYIPDPAVLSSWPRVIRVRAGVWKFKCNLMKAIKGELVTRGNKDSRLVKFTDEEINEAEKYFFRKATLEVKEFNEEKVWKKNSVERDGILYYCGRIVDGFVVESKEEIFSDLDPLHFTNPIVDRYSPLSYAIMRYSHEILSRHRNAAVSLQQSRSIIFVLGGKSLAVHIVENCPKCIISRAETIEVEMADIHKNRLTISSNFYYSQCDLMGPFLASCEHSHRSRNKVWGCVFKCTSTTAVAVYVMETYSTESFLAAFTRLGSRYGYPYKLYIDSGAQLVKGTGEMKIDMQDLESTLEMKFQTGIEVEVVPVGGHNYTGQVERAVLEVKRFFERIFDGVRLSILGYETAFSYISSELNNFPIGVGGGFKGYENLDLITPNRLIVGRNNRRAPRGYATIATPGKILQQHEAIKEKWWDVWKTEALSEFIPGNSKWRTDKVPPSEGDIVMFLKSGHDSRFGFDNWRLGIIDGLKLSEDGLARQAVIRYKNSGEKEFRKTNRSLRSVAILKKVSDKYLMEKLDTARQIATRNLEEKMK